MNPEGTALLALAFACLAGCATTSVRGVVRDGDGRPVAGAILAVEKPGGVAVREPSASETNGCFSFTVRRADDITLVVSAPGRRPARGALRPGGEPLLVNLQDEASGADSTIQEIDPRERRARFERACQPFPDADWIRER